MYCQYCGTQIPEDSLYCEKCGQAVKTADIPMQENIQRIRPQWIPTAYGMVTVLAAVIIYGWIVYGARSILFPAGAGGCAVAAYSFAVICFFVNRQNHEELWQHLLWSVGTYITVFLYINRYCQRTGAVTPMGIWSVRRQVVWVVVLALLFMAMPMLAGFARVCGRRWQEFFWKCLAAVAMFVIAALEEGLLHALQSFAVLHIVLGCVLLLWAIWPFREEIRGRFRKQ